MPKPKRPAPFAVGDVRVRAVRGPDDAGRWYFRAERYAAGASSTAWTGWATRAEAVLQIAALVASGEPRPKPKPPTDDVCETVRWTEGRVAQAA